VLRCSLVQVSEVRGPPYGARRRQEPDRRAVDVVHSSTTQDVRGDGASLPPEQAAQANLHEKVLRSGHVILVAGVACVVLSSIPDHVVWVPFTLTALVTVAQVYVGAHNPST
jgi:membrane-associated phospholipid phosphatase